MVTLCILILGTDSILNTFIFSGIHFGSILHWQCDVGIICSLIGQFGFMLATGLRLYRISKVYNTYFNYLKVQKERLSRPNETSSKTNSLTTSSNMLTQQSASESNSKR